MSEQIGIKVIFLGESSVGKTCLLKAGLGKKFNPNEVTTFSSTYSIRKHNYKDKEYIFHLWDTIGQEKYRSVTKMFFKESDIVFLVYDITSEKSFKELEYWYKQVKEELGTQGYILSILGNKKDLYKNEKVSEAQGKEFAKSKNAIFKLTSAKDDSLGFNKFMEEIFNEFLDKYKNKLTNREGTVIQSKAGKKKGKCC